MAAGAAAAGAGGGVEGVEAGDAGGEIVAPRHRQDRAQRLQLAVDPTGVTTMDSWQPSKEGDRVAIQYSIGGDEESILTVIDTATGLPVTRIEDGVPVIVRGAAVVETMSGNAGGLARNHNLALAQQPADFYAFVNGLFDDCSEDWLEELVRVAGQERAGLVAPRVRNPIGQLDHGGVLLTAPGRAVYAFKGLEKGDPGPAGRAAAGGVARRPGLPANTPWGGEKKVFFGARARLAAGPPKTNLKTYKIAYAKNYFDKRFPRSFW